MTDVSVVVVNYNSHEYLPACVSSILRQQGVRSEVLVVDNASPRDPSAVLDELRRHGVSVLRSPSNRGYGGACNLGLERARGRIVLFLNADVVAGEGCLRRLVSHLDADPQVGLAEPRTWMDDDRSLLIPQIEPLDPRGVRREAWSRFSARRAGQAARERLRLNLDHWEASRPRSQASLTGAFLAGRRELLRELGGFDEGYPLFFEDTDLFRRVRQRGLRLEMLPDAEAVHYGHRSAVTVWNEAMGKLAIGRRRYLRRHHGRRAVWSDSFWGAVARRLSAWRSPAPPEHFVEIDAPAMATAVAPPRERGLEIRADVATDQRWVLELAAEPWFVLAVGSLVTGPVFRLSASTLRGLVPSRYYLRAHALPELRPAGAWTFSAPPAETAASLPTQTEDEGLYAAMDLTSQGEGRRMLP